MSVLNKIEGTAISTFIAITGNGDIFHRICAEIQRVEATMPNATGKDKRAKFLAECEIVFDDLIEPIAESVLRLLLELGLIWLRSRIV